MDEFDLADVGGGDGVEFVVVGCEEGCVQALGEGQGEAVGEGDAAPDGFDFGDGLPQGGIHCAVF